jgi:hypothetical protein
MITVISEVETKALNMGELEELSSTAARELTNRIKAATDDLYEMLWRAHQGKAWAALGYTSWKNYCETEFRMSARHSYRLLDFVEVRNVIREGDPRVTPSSEKQVRPLAQLDREEQPAAWACAVEIADGKQPTGKQVEQAVVEHIFNRDDKAKREVLTGKRQRRSKGELIRKPYRTLENAWTSATRLQHKSLFKGHILPRYSSWLRKELSKIGDGAMAPDAIVAAKVDPVTQIFEELREDVLRYNRDLMTGWIFKFVTNERGDVVDDRAKMLLRSCPTYSDSSLTTLLNLYGENNEKEIVERLLGLRAIES